MSGLKGDNETALKTNSFVRFRGYTNSLQLINVDLTKGIDFNRDRYMNDGFEFYNLVNFSGLTTCRFNIFQVQVSAGNRDVVKRSNGQLAKNARLGHNDSF